MSLKASLVTFVLGIVSLTAIGCGSWQPQPTPGKCSAERHWVAASQDANGNWKEGYCTWDEGKGPNDPRW